MRDYLGRGDRGAKGSGKWTGQREQRKNVAFKEDQVQIHTDKCSINQRKRGTARALASAARVRQLNENP